MENFNPGDTSQLALFEKGQMESAVLNRKYVNLTPVGTFKNSDCVEFLWPGSGKHLVNLQESRLYVKAKIVTEDGSSLQSATESASSEADVCIPVNMLLNSMWKQVDLYIQEENTSPYVSTNYPYKCMIDVLLNGSDEAKYLESSLFYPDTAYSFDSLITDEDSPLFPNLGAAVGFHAKL